MGKGAKVIIACAVCLGVALAVIYGIKTWLAG